MQHEESSSTAHVAGEPVGKLHPGITARLGIVIVGVRAGPGRDDHAGVGWEPVTGVRLAVHVERGFLDRPRYEPDKSVTLRISRRHREGWPVTIPAPPERPLVRRGQHEMGAGLVKARERANVRGHADSPEPAAGTVADRGIGSWW